MGRTELLGLDWFKAPPPFLETRNLGDLRHIDQPASRTGLGGGSRGALSSGLGKWGGRAEVKPTGEGRRAKAGPFPAELGRNCWALL